MHITRLATVVSGLALTAGAVVGIPLSASASAHPKPAKPAACAQQQKQVDKAEDALARAIANFEKAKKAPKAPKAPKATKPGTPAKPTKPVKSVKSDKLAKAEKDKKAQVQRLAKAQDRLAECKAAQG